MPNDCKIHNRHIVAILFIAIVLLTQLWYSWSVMCHPKLYYWSFLGVTKEIGDIHSFAQLKYAWITAVRRQEYSMNYDSNLFVDIYGATKQVLGIHSDGKLTKLQNGWITTRSPIEKDFQITLNFLNDIKPTLDKNNIPVLFVLPPAKINKVQTQLPRGVVDYSNENLDSFITLLKDRHIDYIDLREVFIDNPKEHYHLYLKSDHHWQPQYAFYAYQKTAEKLSADYDFDISPKLYDPNNFQEKIVPVKERPYFSIGVNSQRKQLGRFFTEDDSYLLFEPKFKTHTSLEIPYMNLFIEGDSNKVWRQNALTPLQKAVNRSQKKKIFLIHDSFGPPYFDYLSLICGELWSMDTRKLSNPSDISKTIDEFQPDILIFLLNESSLK